jgi:hypothetical protein
MEKNLLQIITDIDSASLFSKILESGLLQAVLLFGCYTLWNALKKERDKNDQLTEKIITNNITMQEQLKDIVEILKKDRT